MSSKDLQQGLIPEQITEAYNTLGLVPNRRPPAETPDPAGISAADLATWQQMMGYTDAAARAHLGVGSPHTWNKYKAEGAPRTIGLVCAAIAAGITESWRPPLAASSTGAVAIRYAMFGRDMKVLTAARTMALAQSRKAAETAVADRMKPFAHSGFSAEHGYWWARNDDEPFQLHRWWLAAG